MGRLVEVNIEQQQARPIFSLCTDNGDIRCVIDTGAEIPVWCMDEIFLKRIFPDSETTKYATYISGFGKGWTYADVWRVPEIVIKDRNETEQFSIHNLLVAIVPKPEFTFVFIMSASMFLATDYTVINRTDQRFTRFAFDRDSYCVPKISVNQKYHSDGKVIISGISVFCSG